jgi:hypothetical protein
MGQTNRAQLLTEMTEGNTEEWSPHCQIYEDNGAEEIEQADRTGPVGSDRRRR